MPQKRRIFYMHLVYALQHKLAEQVANLRTLTQSLIDKELTADELFGWKKETESPNPLGDKPQPETKSEPDTLKMEGSK